jgi:hypothetical protein
MMKHKMVDYTIIFYENDEYVVSYTLSSSTIDTAIQMGCQELYLDGYPASYYVVYSNSESKEGWL